MFWGLKLICIFVKKIKRKLVFENKTCIFPLLKCLGERTNTKRENCNLCAGVNIFELYRLLKKFFV